jgi:hypothetical protein
MAMPLLRPNSVEQFCQTRARFGELLLFQIASQPAR